MFFIPRTSLNQARDVAHVFDRMVNALGAFDDAETMSTSLRRPAIDVAETDMAYTVKFDLPGVAKEDVKISIEGRQVTMEAAVTKTVTNEADAKENDRMIYRERSLASFARVFTVPGEINQAESGAKLDNGVLTLTLTKRNVPQAAKITVS